MRTVLITGGAGFIGSHLAELFHSHGWQVVVVDHLSTGCLANVAALTGRDGFRFIEADIRDAQRWQAATGVPDLLVHLAASVGVELILANPVESMHNNLGGTETVLRFAHMHGIRILLASSSEVYGGASAVPFSEADPLLIGNPASIRWSYAIAKIADEALARAYHHQFGLPVTVARLFNTVGPRQSGTYGMVLPRFVQQALNGGPLLVFGDGAQRRCFCDVADLSRALFGLAQHPAAIGELFNVGSTEEVSILSLAERVRTLLAPEAEIQLVPYDQAYEHGFDDIRRRVPDIAKIGRVLAWRPVLGLDEIICRVREGVAGRQPAAKTMSQRAGI